MVPVFNEEGSLRQLHEEIVESVKELNAGYDLVSGWKFRRKGPLLRRFLKFCLKAYVPE
ncbi:hypothetical protein KAU86_02960 [bacterium]|nr:hypothetical protein [bacterium]